MTQRTQELAERLSQLPDAVQDEWAGRFLDHLDRAEGDPTGVEKGGSDRMPVAHWIGGRKPSPDEVRQAFDGLRQIRTRQMLSGADVREMIEEGRR